MTVAVQHKRFDASTSVDVESVDFLMRMSSLVPGIIYVFNHNTMSNEYSNRSLAELLGYTPQELIDMGDKVIELCVHEEDLPGLVAYFQSIALLPDGEYTAHEYRDYAKDGSIVWLRSIDTVFERDEDGKTLRHLGIAFDITAEKEAQQHLETLNQELEARVAQRTEELRALNRELEDRVVQRTSALLEANRELEQLSYVATHDLKVPINNMASLTHMLEDARDVLPDEHVETLGWMHEVCGQAAEKLEALVCVTQAHAVWDEDFEEVDLAQLTERVLLTLHFQIGKVNAAIRTDFKSPSVLFLDREVENIIQALVSNALKYRDSQRRLQIKLRSYAEDCHTVLEVTDNGTGVNLPEDHSKVFGLFQRAHVEPDGAGVALYSIRRVMERLGGSINATGSKGVGCTFILRFPKSCKEAA